MKKPKKSDSHLEQKRILELALLSANTIMLERLRDKNRGEENKIRTVEDGIRVVCQKLQSLDYHQQHMQLCNSFEFFDQDQTNAFIEIASVIQSLFPQQYFVQPFTEKSAPFQEFSNPSNDQTMFFY